MAVSDSSMRKEIIRALQLNAGGSRQRHLVPGDSERQTDKASDEDVQYSNTDYSELEEGR